MPYASQSLGSTPLGGLSGGAGNPIPDTLELTLTVHAPLIRIYSNAGTLAALLTQEASAPTVIHIVASPLALTSAVLDPTYAFAATGDVFPLTLTLETPSLFITGDISQLALNLDAEAPAPTVEIQPDEVTLTANVENATPTPTSAPAEFELTLSVQSPTFNASAAPSEVTLTASVLAPIPRIYSLPGTFAQLLNILTPTIVITNIPNELTMTVSVLGAVPQVLNLPAEVTLTADVEAVVPRVHHLGATFNLDLLVLQPTILIIVRPFVPLDLEVSAGFSPTIGSLQPTIVRYIKDPVVTDGCPQCGTYRYMLNSKVVEGEVVPFGRNFDIDKGWREDGYVKCGRCGWTLHMDRHTSISDGSRAGWGLSYNEQATPL